MLYTVLPLEDVLDGIEADPHPTREVVMGGILMEVEPMGDFQARVVRVISSNPQDYLVPQHQPGSIVTWT